MGNAVAAPLGEVFTRGVFLLADFPDRSLRAHVDFMSRESTDFTDYTDCEEHEVSELFPTSPNNSLIRVIREIRGHERISHRHAAADPVGRRVPRRRPNAHYWRGVPSTNRLQIAADRVGAR